jgi:hypothetical protein
MDIPEPIRPDPELSSVSMTTLLHCNGGQRRLWAIRGTFVPLRLHSDGAPFTKKGSLQVRGLAFPKAGAV